MSLLPLPSKNVLCCPRPFLPKYAAASILSLLLLWSADSRASVTDQYIRLTTYASGGTPAKIVTADFNKDGKADIVALNSNHVLSILLGSGNGALGAAKTIATLPANSAGFPTLMVAGDFNGDGNQDVVVVPSPGNVVRVFLGHGDGTFAAPFSISDGLTSAGDLATGDFNGDGKADIVVTNGTSVAALLGKSGGTFGSPIVKKTNLSAAGHLILALGDLNSDSHLDVTVTDGNGNFQVLLGTGSGSFLLKAVFVDGSDPGPPNVIAIGDFNGDGKPDLVSGFGTDLPQFFYGQACIHPGYGDGTFNFNVRTCYDTQPLFDQMLTTNLNGKAGLLFPADPMVVELNSGSGVLTPTSYAAGGSTAALGDFNGDGRQDIVFSNTGGVQVVLNVGSGVLRAPLSMSNVVGAFTVSLSMNSTDFNGDGYSDLALLEVFDEHGHLEPSIATSLGGPKNQFNTAADFFLSFDTFEGFSPAPPAIGDFNHDGFLDIAFGAYFASDIGDTQPFTQVFFGDGKGHMPTQGPVLDRGTDFYAAGDFNRDGNADLASLDGSTFGILIGKGDGTFAPPVTYPVGANPVFVLQRDLNGDGKTDILVVNRDGNDVSVLLGNGNGTFQAQKTFPTGKAPMAVVTGDYNRDGKIDIAVASGAGMSVLLGNGNGTFQPQKTYSATGAMTGIAQVSVRQDGILSLIGVDSASKRFVVLPGVGDGSFGAPAFIPVDRAPISVVAGDFNHDGAPDVVLMARNETGLGIGGFAVFYNQGGDHVTLASSTCKPAPNQSVTFTAHVTSSYGVAGTPSGSITFKDGTRSLGTVSLHAGAASITTHFASGTHKIVAQYGGSSSFNPSPSSSLSIVVGP